MRESKCEVLIIGAGPAGMATAIELKELGIESIRIIEREVNAGGIPRHSFHIGYGIKDLKRVMSGPNYAKRYRDKLKTLSQSVETESIVTDWIDDKTVQVTSPNGIERIQASRIVIATGARERARNARLIAGSRTRGIFTTGSLQQFTYLGDSKRSGSAVVVGAEHVSFSAVMTLKHLGVKTSAVITTGKKHETYWPLLLGARILYRFKYYKEVSEIEVIGSTQVEGVKFKKGSKAISIPCQFIVFTGNWIPDNELARKAGLSLDESKSPVINNEFRTNKSHIFAVGNATLPIKSADTCAVQGRKLGKIIASELALRASH
jgi:thioredoxin reductase